MKVVTGKAIKEQLEPVSWGQKQITTCSHLLIFCADSDAMKRIDDYEKLMVKNKTPMDKAKGYGDIMRGSLKDRSSDQLLFWAQKQCYIALGNAINGAKSLGLDSCPMEGFDPVAYAKILNLPKNLVPTVVCPVGYAADKPRPKLRFPKEELFI